MPPLNPPARPRLNFLPLEDRTTPATAFALSGTNLLAFDTANPTQTVTTAITGVTAGETLVGIDVRPQNGLLYGLGVNATADTASLYAVSTRTGVATPVGTAGSIAFTTDGTTVVDLPDPATVGYGVDFNPAVDRFRVVAGALNFRVNPNTGTPIDGNNNSGTPAGTNPDGAINGGTTTVDATAYTNSQPNNGGVTTQYTLDAVSNSLFIQNPPNAGTQTGGQTITVGGNPLDFTGVSGIDIPAGVNAASSNAAVTSGSAFAVLNVGGTTRLYSINLVTATATFVVDVGNGVTAVQGFAVQSDLGGTPVVAASADGTSLIRFNSATPGTTTTVAITGVTAGETLVGIDYRPQTGQLYGLGVNATADTATLYLLDPQTATATVVGTASQIAFTTDGTTVVDLPDPATAGYGLDFNPTVDRIRVTTGTGLNFRVNPNTGAAVDGNNGGATAVTGTNPDGGINGSGSTGVGSTAYTNAFGQSLTGGVTTQYTLDATSNSLFIQNPPNAGTQTTPLPITLGGSPLDFTAVGGFDIPAGVRVSTSNTAVTSGRGFATLTVSGVTGLYSIDLVTGAATLLGSVGAGSTGVGGMTLADAPAGAVAFTGATYTVTEGTANLAVTLTRTGGSSGAVSVTVTPTAGTADFEDLNLAPVVATFADGQTTTTALIPITDDFLVETPELFSLTLSTPTNGLVFGVQTFAVVTITSDDVAGAVAFTSATYAVTEGTANLAVTLTRTGGSSGAVSVTVTPTAGTATGSDFTPAPVVATFGNGVTTATVLIPITDDTLVEAAETFTLTLSAPTNNLVLGSPSTATATITSDDLPPPPPGPASVTALGTTLTAKNADGTTRFTLTPYGGFAGGFTVALGDVTGDGVADVITGAGAGGAPHVKVFDGQTGAEVRSFFAYGTGFTGGVFVAAGDVNGDGRDDIITGAGGGGAPHVKVFSGTDGSTIRSFLAYAPTFAGGVRVAAGDVSGDGRDDIVTGAGAGGAPHVKAFSGTDLTLLQSFFAYGTGFTGGVFVAAGDLDGDGRAEIVTGAGPGGAPHVKAFDASGTTRASFFAYGTGFTGGVRVAVADVDGDGGNEIVTGAGGGGGPHVKAFDRNGTLEASAFAGASGVLSGVFVG